VEERPPISGNILTGDKALGCAAGHVGRAAGGRNGTWGIVFERAF
jgi:hypothetical protein